MKLLYSVALTAALVLFSALVPAQCSALGNDGFDLGCCLPPAPNLPTPPPLGQTGKYACLNNCALEQEWLVDVDVAFAWIGGGIDDYAGLQVSISPIAPGAPMASGWVLAKYSRTWTRIGGGGGLEQVWRFLLNGDLYYSTGAASPCPVPPPGAAGQPVLMTGFVDYICTSAGWEMMLNLNHHNGCLSHAPWSSRPQPPALAHRDRSYHLVTPSNFDFPPVSPPSGTLLAESVRSSQLTWSPFNYQANSESYVNQASLNDIGTPRCFSCTFSSTSAPMAYQFQQLTGSAWCGGTNTTFSSIPVPGLLPGGMLALGLGFWTTSTGFVPLTVYWGIMAYDDPCTTEAPFFIVSGVATEQSSPATLFPNTMFPVPPARTFIDIGSAKLLPPFSASPWGSMYVSTVLFQLNQ